MQFPIVARVNYSGFWSDNFKYFFCQGQTVSILEMTHNHETWYTTFYMLAEDGVLSTVTWAEGTPEMHMDYMFSRISPLDPEDFRFASI